MATLLDPPKGPSPAKIEEFVEKQLGAARRRVRVLDFFMAGLMLALGSLAFLLIVLLINRYVETPRGTGWAVFAGYLTMATGFIYWMLFRPSRRQINPYFAARQVEQTVPDAKNSLVTWVDFEEDPALPGSIRTAIGQKAARDLKGVDLNRAIENRRIVWLAIAAGVFALANLVVVFLPPTRTELRLEEPENGDITVFNNQDVAFRVHVVGRIPGPNDPDAVRLRMWYNPEDPETYEERRLVPIEGERRKFEVVIPAKQVRFGFRYKLLAGNTQTDEYTVTCKIIPEFTGFEVSYTYPEYLKRQPETSNDPNLLAPYGTTATIIASANREVKYGHIEIEGQPQTIDGQLIPDRPDAIQFTIPMEKEGAYRIRFTTPEGDKNQDPARLRLGVIDPKPVFRTFDIDYEYPAYLRFKPMSVKDVREPEIEAPRGTKVVITAKTNRGVENASLDINGQIVAREEVPDEPMWIRFKLPILDKDATAKASFKPMSGEAASGSRSIPIRVLTDQAPTVQIDEPKEEEKQLPANGTLQLKGLATDDHGVDRLTLQMVVKGAGEDRYLKPKQYRGGMSFLRKEDNSWPTRVEYKDFVKIPDLRLEKDPNWRAAPGTVIEYWLEAQDNCTVPEPNRNVSQPRKRIVVIAPVMKPEEKKKIEQQNTKAEQDQRQHEKKQDKTNATEKRDPDQPPPPGAEQQPGDMGEPGGTTEQPGNSGQKTEPKDGMPPQPREAGAEGTDPNHEQRTKEIQRALEQADRDRNPGNAKPDNRATPDAKVEPGDQKPEPKAGPMDPSPSEDRTPKQDPNKDMTGEGPAGESRGGNIDKTKEEKGEAKPDGNNAPGMAPEKSESREGQEFGGRKNGEAKPDPKETAPKTGMPPEKSVDKGSARPEPGKGDPKDSASADKREPGASKPDKEVTTADKKPAGEPGSKGGEPTPPSNAGAEKPREMAPAGDKRSAPKKDEVADAGSARRGPMDEEPGTSSKPPRPDMNEQARGQQKPGPGSPPDQGAEQGELEREMGELEREINSTKPKIDPNKQAMADQLIRNPETREQMRKKFDEMEKKADEENDLLKKKKTQEMRAAAEKAANDYDNAKPTPENVEKAAGQLASNDPRERKEGEQRIKDWENNPKTRDDLKKEVDELKKKNRDAGDKAENAMNKAETARKTETPKPDEKQLSDIAKNLNGMDEKAKADAKEKLKKMMQDPKTRQEAQERLKEMANKAQGQEKQDLENAAKQAGQMADQFAKKDPPQPKDGKVDPKELEKAAQQLASGDAKQQQEAKEKLKEIMKDPKAAKEAQDELNEMAKNAKTPEDKKALENAAKQAGEMAKEMGPKEGPKPNPQDLKEIAKQMAGNDQKAKEDAEKKLQEMMNDPKSREEAMKALEEMAKNMKNTPEDQKAIEDAMKKASEMAKNQQPPKVDPKDLAELAKEFDKMDAKAKEELKKKFDESMKDAKNREEMKKKAEEMAKNMTAEQKKQFDDMMRQLAGKDYLDEGTPDPADPRNKLKAAELVLDKFKQNQDKLPDLGWTEEQKAQWIKDQEAVIEALRKQVKDSDWAINRNVKTPGGGIVKPELGEKKSAEVIQSGRYAPPSGYVDPYKKFTTGGASPKK